MRTLLKNEVFILITLFLALVILRIPTLIRAHLPTVQWDEYIYLYNAKTLSDYQNPQNYLPTYSFEEFEEESNTLERGLISHYPPLTSAVQSLAFIPKLSSFWTYRLILILNAIAIATAIFPLYRLAKEFFPKQSPLLPTILSATSISLLGKSFWAMSEAILIPLFIWTVYLAWKLLKEDKLLNIVLYGIGIGLLTLTREQALIIIPISLLHYTLSIIAKKGKVNLKHLLLLTTITIAPSLTWQLLNQSSETRLESFLDKGGAPFLDSLQAALIFARSWIRQFDYLYFGSFFLLVPLILSPLSKIRGLKQLRKSRRFHLASLLFLVALGLILPSTIIMTRAQLKFPSPGKYLMYGRYIDALIPLVILFGVGVVKEGWLIGKKGLFLSTALPIIIAATIAFPWNGYYNFYWSSNTSAVFWIPNLAGDSLYLGVFILLQALLIGGIFLTRGKGKVFITSSFVGLAVLGNIFNLWINSDIFLKRQDPERRPLIALQRFVEESPKDIYLLKEELHSSEFTHNYFLFLAHNFHKEKLKIVEAPQGEEGYLLTKEKRKEDSYKEYLIGRERYYIYRQ
jgi:4-amino-4-deoxy-L-arabinose transferase-like glycosyltransferase